jgi:hypothetical protein
MHFEPAIQCLWNRRTRKYEEVVARDFHALGFKVVWQPFLAEKLHAELEKARKIAEKLGVLFDGGKFMEQQRAADGHARGLMVGAMDELCGWCAPDRRRRRREIDHAHSDARTVDTVRGAL